MCGRYAASASRERLAEVFEIDEVAGPLPPASFNVAPTDAVPAVLERLPPDRPEAGPVRKLVELRWGLVPSWSRDATGGARMINARIETVASKPAFRAAFAARRCLLPADGFYEWYLTGATDARGRAVKQPFFLRPADGGLLVMAGLYEFFKTSAGSWLSTCAIITTQATDVAGRIHDRMPMVVDRDHWDAWLDPRQADGADTLLAVHSGELVAYAVSSLVNKVANNGPELLRPLAESV